MLSQTISIIVATMLAAQGPSAAEQATLLQLSLTPSGTAVAGPQQAMAEETAKITSCTEGLKLMDRLKARGLHGSFSLTVKTNIPIAALPAPLRDALRTRPAGRATPVFGDGRTFRVLIRCEPTFIVPPPAQLTQRQSQSI